MRPRPDAGMTLIEMLVALAILSVIGVAGLTMLDTTLNVQRRTEGRLDRIEEIDRALTVLRRDLATAAPGFAVLDEGGLTFLRATTDAPLSLRIALEEGTLTRQVQPRRRCQISTGRRLKFATSTPTTAPWRVLTSSENPASPCNSTPRPARVHTTLRPFSSASVPWSTPILEVRTDAPS